MMSNADKQLLQRLNELKKERQPERDLWRGIELGLARHDEQVMGSDVLNESGDKQAVFASKGVWAVAAAFAVVCCMLWFLTPIGNPSALQPVDTDGLVNIHAPISEQVQINNYALVEAQSAQQRQYIAGLIASYDTTPALTKDWQQQLNELDTAADAIKAALKEDPDNSALIKMLHHVYQQQIALVERVHAPKWQQI
ncbi:hypothetical protein ACOJR9_17665 [Alteromonas sp. A081]|uniref:hypothetical protein n=1 Tax=Alteromonas sp. A081 TaxID=3410269 RepID=UPI003B980E0D